MCLLTLREAELRLEKGQNGRNNFALVKPPVPPLHPTLNAPNFMLKAGIVGLPNVGKSTLFNALTRSRKAEAANYPFCTIDPNVGVVIVPDERAYVLQKIAKTPSRARST